jgi:hypothetical protein
MDYGMGRAAVLAAANAASWWFGSDLPADGAEAIGGTGPLSDDMAGVQTPLTELLRACASEAALSPLGRASLRWDIARCLGNLRRFAEEEARSPAVTREEIAAPLVVTGMPRSGTTFLHHLLACDPDASSPRCWQTMHPYPDPHARGPDARPQQVDRQLTAFALLAPELRGVHPMDSRSPQECTEITAQVFQSLRFETIYRVPGYKKWLAAYGHRASYRFHRRFLQHLQYQSGRVRRWVLKCPDHVFALDALRAAYPGVRVIFLHRDPERVLASVAHLTEILRAPFTRHIDRADIGRQVLEDWARGAEVMQDEAMRAGGSLHLRYADLVARPLETVAEIYRYFDMDLSPPARSAMADFVAANPRGGYGANRYRLDTHGLDADEIADRFAGYRQCFDVPTESRRAAT